MVLWKYCTQYISKFGKLSSFGGCSLVEKLCLTYPQGWKSTVFIPVPKKKNAKECSSYQTFLISHASEVMLKILQARLQQYMNRELSDSQARFRKGRGTRSSCQLLLPHQKSKRVPIKNLFLFYWIFQSVLTVWITTNHGKFWKRWEIQTIWSASWEICTQVR